MYLKSILSLFAFLSLGSGAGAQDAKLQSISAQFQLAVPASWSLTLGQWKYADIIDCFTMGQTCFGNNPTTPYGMPAFPNVATEGIVPEFYMGESEAVVILFRTPPESRYFAFTQYLFNKGTAGDNIHPVFASLGDSLNLMKIGTTGSVRAGENVFNQYAAVIFTQNVESFRRVQSYLTSSGLPPEAANFLPLPKNLPADTLRLGTGPGHDTFSMLMRVALPASASDFSAYKVESPFVVFKIQPDATITNLPAPALGYASEISGVAEGQLLSRNLDQLAADVLENYAGVFNFAKQRVAFTEKTGWDCIAGEAMCNGDNHDARYSLDTPRGVVVGRLKDAVLVVGVNHQKTGKALYINHSVYDTEKLAGIISVTDAMLTTRSALYHAGITDPKDRRVSKYKNLYAYLISYDCNGLEHCLEIPAPTTQNPIGLNPGEPFFVLGRAYVDPLTGVRPSMTEIVPHQVFLGEHHE